MWINLLQGTVVGKTVRNVLFQYEGGNSLKIAEELSGYEGLLCTELPEWVAGSLVSQSDR